jgi:hypothetical protein
MKGGSAASTAVVDLVKTETYEQMNTHFDNLVGGAKTPKTPKKTKTTKTPKASSTPKKTEAKASKSSKSSKTGKNSHKHSHLGGMCMICGGGLMKHMNDFDDKDMKSLYNKKGGANPLYNIKYDITSAFTQPAYGDVTSRGLDASTIKQLSYENPSSLSAYNKFVQYGNVSGSPVMKFNYTGGKNVKKTSAKKVDKKTK